MAQLTSPLTGTFKSIKKQFIAKEKLIKSSLVTQKKRSDNKRKNAERERFIDYERLLERKLNFLGKPIRSVGRKLGFLESLKKFIVNLLLGFITLRLLKYLPQLKGVLSTILRVGDFIIEMSGKLLNGLVTFVDKGYQAYDHAKKLIRNIGGEKAINAFDKLSDQTGSLLNSVMIAGMIFSDFGGVGRGAGPASQAINAGVETITGTLKNEAKKQVAKQGLRVALAPAKAAGIVLGAGYMLWTLQRVYLGKLNEKWENLKDLDLREYAMLVPLSLIVIFLGVYPSAMLDLMNTSVNSMVQFMHNAQVLYSSFIGF